MLEGAPGATAGPGDGRVDSRSVLGLLRPREQVAAWFEGFRLVPPGLADADAWRRAGNGRTTAPIVAGIGMLDGAADSRESGSGVVA